MSPLGIVGLVWLGFSLFGIAVAVHAKLRPVALWICVGLLLGPWSIFWVGAGIAKKRRLPSYSSGPSRYGAGGTIGGGFGG